MRVISGNYGSRRLKAVPGQNTRPTTDKIKESMFNLIGGYFDGGICLDLYAGSGALAIEAVSRGMDSAVLCEKHRPAIETINENLKMTKEEERFTLLKGDNHKSLRNYASSQMTEPFKLLFLDPSYHKQQIEKDIQWLWELEMINNQTTIVCETDSDVILPDRIEGYELVKVKDYGATRIHIYEGEENSVE
ncbi:16S rRNA (guanine(966)-N(2))-methyltransferase RsmD [Ruoffia tabacinasalis]|jgi:16S rRNA (guanine(966)-N(2))-methyltransferase RsmD|uniref:16S rRNA (Guanine(966)-N(2))-methyltransferase RsmD n=1 Tax=Ruoffia tabacinasalis TaxID=87458 RepID=A0ABS0LK93_9LACT|nr:16S rRNA (guanine(966)-N(2))-methyltransferase RsmD [Ruoffia tabacinasalis]MBG9978703.1 16S rRNA (guanine(966)-N(2))-methyltransferase RsmD [Ruoffia tabacinasalis]